MLAETRHTPSAKRNQGLNLTSWIAQVAIVVAPRLLLSFGGLS